MLRNKTCYVFLYLSFLLSGFLFCGLFFLSIILVFIISLYPETSGDAFSAWVNILWQRPWRRDLIRSQILRKTELPLPYDQPADLLYKQNRKTYQKVCPNLPGPVCVQYPDSLEWSCFLFLQVPRVRFVRSYDLPPFVYPVTLLLRCL